MGKRKLSILAGLAALSLLSACGGGSSTSTPPPPTTLTSVQVTGANANLTVGQTEQMTATGLYSNNTSQKLTGTATWSSSDANVASVSSGGLLTAKNSGSCSITAKSGSISGSFNLTVTPGLVSIAITPA